MWDADSGDGVQVNKLFAASIYAKRSIFPQWEMFHIVRIVRANNQDEALGIFYKEAKEIFPINEGYVGHDVVMVEVKDET